MLAIKISTLPYFTGSFCVSMPEMSHTEDGIQLPARFETLVMARRVYVGLAWLVGPDSVSGGPWGL